MRLSSVLTWLQSDDPAAKPPPDPHASLLAASFELVDVGVAHVGLDGKILRANANFRALLGYDESEIVGLDKLALVHEDNRAAVAADHLALSSGAKTAYSGERVYLTRAGAAVSAWTSARLIGDPPIIQLVVENVIARQDAERALRESEERFELAMRGANEGLWDWRIADNQTYLSPRWKSMLGYAEHEIADEPSSWAHLTAPGVIDAINEQLRRLEAREIDTYELEIKLRHKDGRWLDILSRGFPVFDAEHRIARLVGTHQDITLRKRQEAELRLSSTVFANTHEGIVVADFSGCIQAVNPAFETLTGFRADEVRGRRVNLLKSGRHDALFYDELYRDINTTGRWRGEIWNRCKDGRVQPFWATISVVRDDHGEPVGYVALYSDIGEFKRSQARLDFLAHHDADTALPNRLSLGRRIDAALVEIGERGDGAALFHLELDRFRTIVESLGHAAGDELLAQSSKRFLAKLSSRDMLARIGSDEFAILRQPCASLADARALAGELVAEMERPFVFASGATAYSGVNVGLVWFANSGGDAELLMRQAESALYVAKDSGGVRVYEPRHMIEARERLEMEIGLRRALERDEFVLQYQPLINMKDRRTFGVEALVRWLSPDGVVPPGRFIPLAEKTGLIVQIGEWVLKRAAQRMKAWLDAGAELDTLAINISPRQFERPDLCETIADILNAAGLPFSKVEIEITESVLMEQKDAAAKLAHLRAMGLRISVDDFGTGHSSLAYLKNFPIDKLKLDRAFILDVPADSAGMEIASAVIRLGHSLNVEVLAEGVETEAQAEFLERSGCRLAQGYLFGRPMWEEDLLASLVAAQSEPASEAA
ncbi:MAG: EAL domain-containing protein [Pseudomonadota bacterium]|nr:EAL domain-containing protein [Pseudomonadota bacterium]